MPSATQQHDRPAGRDGGYAKGDETRQAILAAALSAFGEAGYGSASTRQIAKLAGVTLPAITYYFGGKEGLYLTCAHEVVRGYLQHTAAVSTLAYQRLAAGVTPAAAIDLLERIFDGLIDVLVRPGPSQGWTSFVARELQEPGLARQILYDDLWRPGVALVTDLLIAARGGAADREDASVDALLLIACLMAFKSGRSISMRFLDWEQMTEARVATIRRAIRRQIALISVADGAA